MGVPRDLVWGLVLAVEKLVVDQVAAVMIVQLGLDYFVMLGEFCRENHDPTDVCPMFLMFCLYGTVSSSGYGHLHDIFTK